MKIETGKTYRLKNGSICKIVDKKTYNDDERFLGVLTTIPECFWYTPNGRLYNDGISPFDIEKEITTKLQFKTKIRVENNTIIGGWPKKEIIESFLNKPVKVTIELNDDK